MKQHIQSHPKILLLLLILILFAFAISISFIVKNQMYSDVENDLKDAKPPTNFSYINLEGQQVELEIYQGKPLVVNTWATWVPFTQTEFPILNNLKRQFGDTVHIVAMNRKENAAIIRSFMNTYNLEREIDVLIDPNDHFYTTIGGYAMPETVLYDKNGIIVWHKRGVLEQEELASVLRGLVQ